MREAGLRRRDVYITNAVKHFKWEPRGKLRLHKNPSAREVAACRPWLAAEIDAVCPIVIVCLGATAARALLGAMFRLTQHLGESFPGPAGTIVTATFHPAVVVRTRKREDRLTAFERLVADLRRAAQSAEGPEGMALG
jgi:DNA polymerase